MIKCNLWLSTPEPLCTPEYPISLSMKMFIEKEVHDMLKLGVVERACFPYNSPLALVKKPDQMFRLCVDFRQLYNTLVSDAEPIPRTNRFYACRERE